MYDKPKEDDLMKVWVDADACPRNALHILQELQQAVGFQLITVASFNHFYQGNHHITVGDESQAADMAIINGISPGDLVVTQDWGLAAMVLGKKALAISPKGFQFLEKNIDFMLEERHLKAELRRSGCRSKGPAVRTAEDDMRFREAVLKVISPVTMEMEDERS